MFSDQTMTDMAGWSLWVTIIWTYLLVGTIALVVGFLSNKGD